VQLLDEVQLLLLRELEVVLGETFVLLDGRGKPLFKRRDRVENLGQQKVEQGPQLGEVVLQGCAREQETVLDRVRLTERASETSSIVLQSVTLVDNEVDPLDATEHTLVLNVPL